MFLFLVVYYSKQYMFFLDKEWQRIQKRVWVKFETAIYVYCTQHSLKLALL